MWRIVSALCLGLTWLGGVSAQESPTPGRFIVHEWGTFLSVQGSDGVTLGGMVESEEGLPPFVLQRGPLGWERMMQRNNVYSKMETPVTYFYTDRERYISFEASMPRGLLTHWYPTVSAMSPEYRQGESVRPDAGSKIVFGRFRINPVTTRNGTTPLMPLVPAHDPWQAMRQPDSALVSFATGLPVGKPQREEEKFLFYRGLGTFQLPLVVKSQGKHAELILNIQNQSPHLLAGMFLIEVMQDGKLMRWLNLGELPSQGQMSVRPHYQLPLPMHVPECTSIVKQHVAQSLVATGLYPKEAAAMVDHWEKSYFQTPGLRILYVIPRQITDQHIPIKVMPVPHEIVRTMVGRVELITPEMEGRLIRCLNLLHHGNSVEKLEAEQYLASFGRFRQALLRRALQLDLSQELKDQAEELLTLATATLITQDATSAHLSMAEFLGDAIVNGLKQDNVPIELVSQLHGRDENFVAKCTICFLVRKSLAFYAGTAKPTGEMKLSRELVKRLQGTDQIAREEAMRELVDKYIKQAWQKLRLTEDAKRRLDDELQTARKEAAGLMRPGQKFCPSCDGACRILK